MGANDGSTSIEFKEWWPNAKIHCFEPQEECWIDLDILEKNSFNFDILDFEASYQNRFYMNGNLVDVDFHEEDMINFLNEHKIEIELVAQEFVRKIYQFKTIKENKISD